MFCICEKERLELSVNAGILKLTAIPTFKNVVIKQVMVKLSDKLLTHFFRQLVKIVLIEIIDMGWYSSLIFFLLCLFRDHFGLTAAPPHRNIYSIWKTSSTSILKYFEIRSINSAEGVLCKFGNLRKRKREREKCSYI